MNTETLDTKNTTGNIITVALIIIANCDKIKYMCENSINMNAWNLFQFQIILRSGFHLNICAGFICSEFIAVQHFHSVWKSIFCIVNHSLIVFDWHTSNAFKTFSVAIWPFPIFNVGFSCSSIDFESDRWSRRCVKIR